MTKEAMALPGADHAFVGEYVLIRSYASGVHFGKLAACRGDEVFLEDARRIWHWTGAFTLSKVAMSGIKEGKLSVKVPAIYMPGVCEVLPCSEAAAEQLRNFPEHQLPAS